MLLRLLKTLTGLALTAPPFILLLVGCSFDARKSGYTVLDPGAEPQSTLFLCDIEIDRVCATDADIAAGIDLDRRDKDGFWVNRSGFGLDYSPAATGECQGRPQKVTYQGDFPRGSAGCVNAGRIGPGAKYASVVEACHSLCAEHYPNDDGELCGKTKPSFQITEPIAGGCTASGMPRSDFFDTRLLPPAEPVVWLDDQGVIVSGNSLEKMFETLAYDAGAAGEKILGPGRNGAIELTATETDRERMIGFGIGPRPDLDPTDADITYGVVLARDGILTIVEKGAVVHASGYATGDVIRIAVLGSKTNYFKNGARFYMGGAVPATDALRVTASLRDREAGRGATLADVKTLF